MSLRRTPNIANSKLPFSEFSEAKRQAFEENNQSEMNTADFELLGGEQDELQIAGVQQTTEATAQKTLIGLINPKRTIESVKEKNLFNAFKRYWNPDLFTNLYSSAIPNDKRNIVINIRKEETMAPGELVPSSVKLFVDVTVEYTLDGIKRGYSNQSFEFVDNRFIPGSIHCDDPIIKELLMKDSAVYISTIARDKLTTAPNPTISALRDKSFTYKSEEGGEFELWEHFYKYLIRSKIQFGDKVFFDPVTHETFSRSPEYNDYVGEKKALDEAIAAGNSVPIDAKDLFKQHLGAYLKRKNLDVGQGKRELDAYPTNTKNIVSSGDKVALRLELYKFLSDHFNRIKADNFFEFVVTHYSDSVYPHETPIEALKKTADTLAIQATGSPLMLRYDQSIPQFYIGLDGNFHMRNLVNNIALIDSIDNPDEKRFSLGDVSVYSDIFYDSNGCHFNESHVSAPTEQKANAELVEQLYLGTATAKDVPFIPHAPLAAKEESDSLSDAIEAPALKPNFFQRAWGAIKNFAKEHPYVTGLLVVLAIAVIATAITIGTLGVGAVPAAVGLGLGAAGLSSTATGAAIVGFFSAAGAAVATGATVAATAIATAITVGVTVGVPLLLYGLAAGVTRLGVRLRDKISGKPVEAQEPEVGGGSHKVMRGGLDVKPDSPRSAASSLSSSTASATQSTDSEKKNASEQENAAKHNSAPPSPRKSQ